MAVEGGRGDTGVPSKCLQAQADMATTLVSCIVNPTEGSLVFQVGGFAVGLMTYSSKKLIFKNTKHTF